MPRKKKGVSRKVYVAISLLIIVVISISAIIYAYETHPPVVNSVVGVKVGDTFIYSLTGTVYLYAANATIPDSFNQFNNTNYYKVEVTAVNGTLVSIATEWRFNNGTSINNAQQIDLPSGNLTDANGFWGIYNPNINKNDLIRPAGTDGITVNGTSEVDYPNSTRTSNYWSIQHSFFDQNDPTLQTTLLQATSVYFDKQTGIMLDLVSTEEYSNPAMATIVTWKLVASNVWTVL
jgi:hypothetical protein